MSVPEERFKKISERLNNISDKEWKVIISKCKDHIDIKLKHKRAFGAHSEKNLGMPAIDYYLGTAIDKVYSGIWDWKYEKFTILEQLTRIIDSMISEVVRKFKSKQKHPFSVSYKNIEEKFYNLSDANHDNAHLYDDPEYYENMIATIEEAINGNTELEDFFLCIMEGMNTDLIAQKLSWTKKKVYKTTEKLQRKVRSHIKSNSYAKKNRQ